MFPIASETIGGWHHDAHAYAQGLVEAATTRAVVPYAIAKRCMLSTQCEHRHAVRKMGEHPCLLLHNYVALMYVYVTTISLLVCCNKHGPKPYSKL